MIIHNIINYTIAFILTFLLVIYVLNIPQHLTNQIKLVKEYYYDNFEIAFIFDYFLCLLYLLICIFCINLFKCTSIIWNYIIIFCISILISSVFYVYFINTNPSDMFFSRWMRKAGYNAIIYDGIYISILYFIYNIVNKYIYIYIKW